MPAETQAPAELANVIDAHGRRVTATETRSGLAVILTRSLEKGLRDGHPALTRENARVIGRALLDFADREPA